MTHKVLNCSTSTAVDWLTVTSKSTIGGRRLINAWETHKEGEVRGTRFFGFDCVRDQSGLTWGQRTFDGLSIFIASGEIADKVWRDVVPVATKVTRFDLAVDVWLDEPRDQVRQSARVPMSSAFNRKRKYTYISGAGPGQKGSAGDTLYVGSRKSTQYGRFYDKGLQKDVAPPGKWLRYEVEYKGQASLQMSRKALSTTPAQFGEFVKCAIFAWFLDRSVVPVFQPQTDTPGAKVRAIMQQTTPEKKLAWLSTQVKPTVQFLFEIGMRNKVLAALDIDFVELPGEVYSTIPTFGLEVGDK